MPATSSSSVSARRYAARSLSPRELLPACAVLTTGCGRRVASDTAMFHGGCSAEDASGISAAQGPDELLRAIYILGMTPTRLKTADELHARRLAYELGLNWYPDSNHRRMVERV